MMTCHLEDHEERVGIIEEIGIMAKALVYDDTSRQISSAADPDADKQVYASVFQAWADGEIPGTADELFEAVKEVLDRP